MIPALPVGTLATAAAAGDDSRSGLVQPPSASAEAPVRARAATQAWARAATPRGCFGAAKFIKFRSCLEIIKIWYKFA